MSGEKNINSMKSIENIMKYMGEQYRKNDYFQRINSKKEDIEGIEQEDINDINIDEILNNLKSNISIIKSNIKDDIIRDDNSNSANNILKRLNEINSNLNRLEEKKHDCNKEESEDWQHNKKKRAENLFSEDNIDRLVKNYKEKDLSEIKQNLDDLYKNLSMKEEEIEQLKFQRAELLDIIVSDKECNTSYISQLEEIYENISSETTEKDKIQKDFKENINKLVSTIEGKNNALNELHRFLDHLVK